MKKQWIVLWIVALAISTLAQQTNDLQKGSSQKRKHEHSKMTERQRREHSEKKYKFLDKSLTQMGVGKEDRIKIRNLQIEHRKKMKANMQRMNKARKALSELEESAADEAKIEQAIQEITAAQGGQLRILVSNRREMENILGKEKYAQFMENARAQYRKHDRRSGADIPPRPDLPPLPNQNRRSPPPTPLEGYLHFLDRARAQFFESRRAGGERLPPPTPEEYNRFMDRARAQFFESHRPGKPR